MIKSAYRVTPKKRKKGDKWIVQKTSNRKQVGKPFRLKTEAFAYKLELDIKNGRSIDPMQKFNVEDIDILLGNLKFFYKKLYKHRKTIKI